MQRYRVERYLKANLDLAILIERRFVGQLLPKEDGAHHVVVSRRQHVTCIDHYDSCVFPA
jgi:hypothetical protein